MKKERCESVVADDDFALAVVLIPCLAPVAAVIWLFASGNAFPAFQFVLRIFGNG